MRKILRLGIFLFAAESALAYVPGKFYYQGHPKEKVIALSFDDGPGPFTPKILDYLKLHHARATFFMLGDQVPMYPTIAKQVLADGHEIGNHTFTHSNWNTPKNAAHPERFIKELDDTEAEIVKAIGQHTHVVRMPYGALGKHDRSWLLPTLKQKGYALVHWSFGEDWLTKRKPNRGESGTSVPLTPETLAADYEHNAFPGAVFLMHDGGKHRERTFAALQLIIPALEQKGYRFIACEDMFPDSGTAPKVPTP